MSESLKSITIEPPTFEKTLKKLDTQKDGDFLQKIEQLTKENEILNKKNIILEEDLEKSIQKIESLYLDKVRLEELVLKIDDNHLETEIENIKQKTEEHFVQKFDFKIDNLENEINELKHNCLNLELKNKELLLKLENNEKEIDLMNNKIMYYEENYVQKQKYESLNIELSMFKTENTDLDTRVMFKDIKVKELEKKILENEEKHKNKLIEVQNKIEKKLEQEKEVLKLEISKLNEKLILMKDVKPVTKSTIQDHQILNKMYFLL